MKTTQLGLFAVLVVAAATSGCRNESKGATDTNSNWLIACENDTPCGDEFDCLCGVCSRPCERSQGCADLGSDAACVPVADCAETAICGTVEGVELGDDAQSEPEPAPELEPAAGGTGGEQPCSYPIEDYLYLGDGCEVDADCDMFYDACGCGCLPESNGDDGSSGGSSGRGSGGTLGNAGATPGSGGVGGSRLPNAGSGGTLDGSTAGAGNGGGGAGGSAGSASGGSSSGGTMNTAGTGQGEAGAGSGGAPSTACTQGESTNIDSASCMCIEDDVWSCTSYVASCEAVPGTPLDVVVRTEYGSMPFSCFDDAVSPRPIHSDDELEAALCGAAFAPSGVDWSSRMMYVATVYEGQELDLLYAVQYNGVVRIGVQGSCQITGAAPGNGVMFVEFDIVDTVFVEHICVCPVNPGPEPEPLPP